MQTPQELEQKHKLQIKSTFVNYERDILEQNQEFFNKKLSKAFYKLNHQRKKQMLEEALKCNQQFLNKIIDYSNQCDEITEFKLQPVTSMNNRSKIKTTLKQFFREWCGQSLEKNDYMRIVDKCKQYLKKKDCILVPGSGLGRLVFDLVSAGFGAEGNEVTFFMLFASNFIINCSWRKEQFKIYPFIHSLDYYYNEEDMYRSVMVPDVVSSELIAEDINFSIVGGEFIDVYGQESQKYEGIATCFFIDTANNIFEYIDTFYKCLKNQGIWINFGPLLYHYRQAFNQMSIELSWQALRKYIQQKFIFLEEELIETTYCHDPKSKMSVAYKCISFVCRKREKV